MALIFDKIISECENVSLEDLSIESLVPSDLDPNSNTFNDLFEDHLSVLRRENNISENDGTEDTMFDLEIDCADIDKMLNSECDLTDSLGFDNLNIIDLDSYPSTSIDNDIIFMNDEIYKDGNNTVNEKESKKNSRIIRRQSTRIENQTRKKIADQIQRENIRLAMEAQLLNNKVYEKIKAPSAHIINGRPVSPEMERYLSMPTDLDAEDDNLDDEVINSGEVTSDDDPNKVWCLCRKPHGDRFMICCDNCLEWYHGDCVGITQQESTDIDEFICPSCKISLSSIATSNKSEDVVIIDDEDDDKDFIGEDDEDCLIIKAVEPLKFNENIFQLLKKSQDIESNKPKVETSSISVTPLSKRTSVCLSKACKTLVNPKKSLYCSRNCIDKYTKMVIKNNLREKAKQYGLPKGPKLAKMTRFVLAQPSTETIQDEFTAPTEDTLKEFLIRNPTYKVYQNSKPVKAKEHQVKSKKFLELVNNDPSKHIKIVKLFATLFKKLMVPKSFNQEFRNIWQHCMNIEIRLFENCDKVINDKYMSKVKELSEYLKCQTNDILLWDVLKDKLSIADFLSMTKDQLDSRSRLIIIDDSPALSTDKPEMIKKSYVASKGGISLLSDTTHLHGRHLYDINCKVCNGAQKSITDIKQKDKDCLLDTDVSSCTEWPAEDKITCSSNNDESIVTSSVETPDMVVDMEMCSSSSEKDEMDLKINKDILVDNNVDSSSIEIVKVLKPQKRKLTSLWQGNLIYKDVGSVMCKSYLVTRFFLNKDNEKEQEILHASDDELLDVTSSLNNQIIINGRSHISETQSYLSRLRKHSNKEFLILRLHPSNLDEGGKTYRAMFEFLHSRERCGVISDKRIGVKDCFIYPLNAHMKIPSIFMPFIGPGLEKRRPHLLLLIIVRTPSSNVHYKPISPKYDQDDDFVRKHGINLDKYCYPNLNFPFCPSPIVKSNEVERWVLNSKSNKCENLFELNDSKTITLKSGIETIKEIDQNIKKESNELNKDLKKKYEIKDAKKLSKAQKNKDRYSNESLEYIINNIASHVNSDIPIIKLCDIPLPDAEPGEVLKKDTSNEKHSDIYSTLQSRNIINGLINEKSDVTKENELIEKYEDLKNDTESERCTIPYSLMTESIKNNNIIEKYEIVHYPSQMKISKADAIIEVVEVLNNDIISKNIDTIYNPSLIKRSKELIPLNVEPDFVNHYSSVTDLSLQPTPFVYRSLIKSTPKSNTYETFDENIVDETNNSVINNDNTNEDNTFNNVDSTKVDNEIIIAYIKEKDFSEDIDLRYKNLQQCSKFVHTKENEIITVSSNSLFVKRKHCSRLYTLYDCFPNDINSKSKRMKYFFNPFYQISDLVTLNNDVTSPLIIDDGDGCSITEISVDRERNISPCSSL